MKKLLFIFSVIVSGCTTTYKPQQNTGMNDKPIDNKIIIYQMMTRLFGNTNTNNKTYGTLEENGVGKFNDITSVALDSLKALGITHLWYTGVIEHATMSDFTKNNIPVDDPDVIKGIAGSPYAIKDYYDVNPALAVSIQNRMPEFENLIQRTHSKGLKAIIDFVPNHVARKYHSDAKPFGVVDFGEKDNKNIAFSAMNDFYYIPEKAFVVPEGVKAGGNNFYSKLKDKHFDENPAKVTGNNVFKANPSIDDWYETVKLNYGVDFQNNERKHFSPTPPVWYKMRDILVYWTKKGIDGFRCDMAEMVPVEFWEWVIPQVKKVNPKIIFIAEAYNPKVYKTYLTQGNFDFLYDKVDLYDTLKTLIKQAPNATVKSISSMNKEHDYHHASRMLRFLENHDEERIASDGFAKNPWNAKAAMIVTATLSSGPVMIYFGQETGEPGKGVEGFGGEDNRTTIFDYWGVPNYQKWMNNGKFDGGQLNEDQKQLRDFYKNLLKFSGESDAIRNGRYNEINAQLFSDKQLAYKKSSKKETIFVIANFDTQPLIFTAKDVLYGSGLIDILKNEYYKMDQTITIPSNDAIILKLSK